MARFLLNCPKCSQKIQGDDDCVGLTFECPKCKEPFTVPKPNHRLPCPSCRKEIAIHSEWTQEASGSGTIQCPYCTEAFDLMLDECSPTGVAENPSLTEPACAPPEIFATCPKCRRKDVPFVCPNCEKATGGMTLRHDGSIECYCGIESDMMTCPDCHTTITKKFFRANSANPPKQKAKPELKFTNDANGQCPNCQSAMGSGDVICTSCGLNVRTKQLVGSVKSHSPTSTDDLSETRCSECHRAIPAPAWAYYQGLCKDCCAERRTMGASGFVGGFSVSSDDISR